MSLASALYYIPLYPRLLGKNINMAQYEHLLSTATDWLTTSFQAAFTIENVFLTACYIAILRLSVHIVPHWLSSLGLMGIPQHKSTTKTHKIICFICLHLVSISLAAACQLGSAIASRGFQEGPHSDKGYWFLLQSTRFIVASYWAEMLFNESIKKPMIIHHLITILIIAQLPTKGQDTSEFALAYQRLACFWLLQANFEQVTYFGLLGRWLGWEESRRNRILLMGANIAMFNKTVSTVGVFATWYFQIQSSASGPLTFGFYTCSAALAIKQYYTIKALRRMATRSSASSASEQHSQSDTPAPAPPGRTIYMRPAVRRVSGMALAPEILSVANQDTEGARAAFSVKCRFPHTPITLRAPVALGPRREQLVETV